MNAPERLARDETLQGFIAKGKLPKCQITLAAQTAFTKPNKVCRSIILRTIDDAEIFAATNLERRLNKTFLALSDKLARLDDHAFAAAVRQRLPPSDGLTRLTLVRERDLSPLRARDDAVGH